MSMCPLLGTMTICPLIKSDQALDYKTLIYNTDVEDNVDLKICLEQIVENLNLQLLSHKNEIKELQEKVEKLETKLQYHTSLRTHINW